MNSRYNKTFIEGLFEIHNESFIDQRGTFINSYRHQENTFFQTWSDRDIKQINISFRNYVEIFWKFYKKPLWFYIFFSYSFL